jgi:ubiquinone/menaquinone biosynthesis C-methylase UbiE
LTYTENFRKYLVEIIKHYEIKEIFDCSSGDWNWMKEIYKELPDIINYTGNDIVPQLVEYNNNKYGSDRFNFVCNDMLSQLKTYNNQSIDLVLCRHTLEHLPLQYCIDVVTEIKRVSKRAIITSSNSECNVNVRNTELIISGHNSRQINLDLSPFIDILGVYNNKFVDTAIIESEPIQKNGCWGYDYFFDNQGSQK